jgi:predicted DNA-binding antitoxin AbrB/MazE fold protein
MTVKAIYKNGVFVPTEPVDLPESSEVRVSYPRARRRLSQAEATAAVASLRRLREQFRLSPEDARRLAEDDDEFGLLGV